jgi:hypothetical protein
MGKNAPAIGNPDVKIDKHPVRANAALRPSSALRLAPPAALQGLLHLARTAASPIAELISLRATRRKEFMKIAYFEGFNWDRPCLNMEVTDIPAGYTHIHFGFANLT